VADNTFIKNNHSHNKGWARDIFSDIAVIEGNARLLFLSGVGAEDPDATDPTTVEILGGADFAEQTRIAFTKIKSLLAAHGATMHDIVRMTAYVTEAANIWTYFQIQGEALEGAPRPPHTFLRVAGLAVPEMLVEIEVTAAIPAG
jgi:enamine deaminase RidA (YjgF/YER057c/UK114 family)